MSLYPPRQFWFALVEGSAWSAAALALVLAIAWTCGALKTDWMPKGDGGLLSPDFARRFDGGCHGWTRQEAWHHLRGNIAHWWSYCTIAFVFWRLHPPLKTVPYSQLTLTLVGWFILGCGIGHLLAALTMLLPVYRVEGRWLEINGMVSTVATVFVAYSLTRAFDVVQARRAEVDKMRSDYARLKRVDATP